MGYNSPIAGQEGHTVSGKLYLPHLFRTPVSGTLEAIMDTVRTGEANREFRGVNLITPSLPLTRSILKKVGVADKNDVGVLVLGEERWLSGKLWMNEACPHILSCCT